MNDREIEERLARMRPAGPPAQLRARILSASSRPQRVWPWIAAAAAALLMTATLQVAAASLRGQVRTAAVISGADAENELASSLEAALGVSADEARMVAMVDGFRSRIEAARASQEGRGQ